MPKSNAEVLRRSMQNLKDLGTNPRATAKRMGFRYVDTVEDAQEELKSLPELPVQKINELDVRSRYAKMVGDKMSKRNEILYNLGSNLGITGALSLLGTGIGALTYGMIKGNNKSDMRSG
jgi:hypothetical protein